MVKKVCQLSQETWAPKLISNGTDLNLLIWVSSAKLETSCEYNAHATRWGKSICVRRRAWGFLWNSWIYWERRSSWSFFTLVLLILQTSMGNWSPLLVLSGPSPTKGVGPFSPSKPRGSHSTPVPSVSLSTKKVTNSHWLVFLTDVLPCDANSP